MGVRKRLLKFAGPAALCLALPLTAAEPPRPEAGPANAAVIPRLLWITGHNELKIDGAGPDGASDVRKALEAAFPGQAIQAVYLANLAEAPRDAVLILAGPKRDFSEDEAAKLRSLLTGGARLLACLDPNIEHDRVDLKNLRAVLRELGADVGTDRIVDREAALLEPPGPMPKKAPSREPRDVFAARFNPSDHALLSDLPKGARIVFENACRVSAMSAASDPFDVRELAATSASAFAVGALGARGPAGPVLVAGTRRAGPGRYVVAGDSTFLTNGFANRNGLKDAAFAIASIRWLAVGVEATPPARPDRSAKSSVRDEDREPLVIIAAVVAAALLFAGNALFAKRS